MNIEKVIELFLARNYVIEGKAGENLNTIAVGPPGAGKTFSNFLMEILKNVDKKCSFIIDDKKGSLKKKTSVFFRKKGYIVKVFDMVHFNGNLKYNPFASIRTREDIMKIVNYLLPNDKRTTDQFWVETSRMLLICIIELGKNLYGNKFNFQQFFELLDKVRVETDVRGKREDDEISIILSNERKNGKVYGAIEEYEQLRNSADDTWKSIVISTRASVSAYRSPELLDCMSYSNFNFEEMATKKVILYVISSDTDTSIYPLIQLLYSDITDQLFRYADFQCEHNGDMLPQHVRFYIDDFASGVRQEHFENVIANARSRNISYFLNFQSIAQLKSIYRESAETIMDCADYKVFYSSSSLSTLEYLSKLCNAPLWDVQKMDKSKVWIVQRGCAPQMLERNNTMDQDEYKMCMELRNEMECRTRSK